MNLMLKSKSWSGLSRPGKWLDCVMDRVTRIRKLLRGYGVLADRDCSRVRDDATRLCELVERLCRRGRFLEAEEAKDCYEMVDLLVYQLEAKCLGFIASRRKHVKS